jgi:hypothetical protein
LPPVLHSGLTHATTAQFFNKVFSLHNLYLIFLEFTLSLPLLFMVWVRNLTRGRKIN